MYAAEHDGLPQFNSRNARPLSFLPSPRGEVIDTPPLVARQLSGAKPYAGPRFHNPFQEDDLQMLSSANRSMTAPVLGSNSADHDGWRTRTNGDHGYGIPMHDHTGDDAPSFSLGEIDVDTSPDAVAREFSNLQALRRMSMDVNLQDPDLPAFAIPAVAPANDVDDNDPSRMYWVPARLHPELAPKEFKSFIQEKVKTIKRSSLSTSLSEEQTSMQTNSGSLRRRKSMLSRQIDSGYGYEDGAVRLQRKKSLTDHNEPEVNLQELEQIMSDPNQVASRLSMEALTLEPAPEGVAVQDLPMLPVKPLGPTLKRSTRTQYRKGSLRKKPLLSRKQTLREEDERSESPTSIHEMPRPQGSAEMSDLSDFADQAFGLSRSQTDPVLPPAQKPVENFSRPGRRVGPAVASPQPTRTEAPAVQQPAIRPQRLPIDDQQSQFNNRQSPVAAPKMPIPQIIEPTPEPFGATPRQEVRPVTAPAAEPTRSPPMDQGPLLPQQIPPRPMAQRPATRPQSLPHQPPTNHRAQNITLDDIAASSMLSSGAEESKKPDKKSKGKDESKKTSWGWFSGGSSDKEEKEGPKRNKLKSQKVVDKSHDGARLDVLQGAIDGTAPKTRESGVFDRSSLQIEDDGRKGSKRGSSEQKKEKDGLFSSLFGGSKKKADKDGASSKKHASSLRGLSPDIPRRMSRPDIDYQWTRFSITEERAIYRMAHIKLANPRRELYSQVLLSNFMYSYLAKVQQMHPHVQIPQSAAQKQAQRQERQLQQKQAEEERKQERLERQKEQEMQRQMKLAQESQEGDYAQHQHYQENQYDHQYGLQHESEGQDDQAMYEAHRQQAQMEYQRYQAQYGQQQYSGDGSQFPNGNDWPSPEDEEQQHQWYQTDDQHARNGGREGLW